jgi:hypothetical protein
MVVSRNTRYGTKCTHHGENLPIPVCKLVAEESGKSDVLDSTLSGGLWGIMSDSGCRGSCDWRNRHSVTDVGETETTSAGVLLAIFPTTLAPLTADITSSCDVVSTPSVRVFDDGSPSRGLSNPVGDGVRRLSIAGSEGDEVEDDWVVEPMTGTSGPCCKSGLKNSEP